MSDRVTESSASGHARFLLLGPFRVADEARDLHDMRGRTGTVLAALVVGEGALVSADRLIDILWGEALPASPDNALHTVVSRLRTALEPLGLDDRVVTEAGGYRLLASADEVDARRFEAAVKATGGPSDVTGVQRLRSSLDLWRGPALEGLRASHPHFSAEADRLDSLWFTALEITVEGDLIAGRHRNLVPELVALTARYPTRETLWGFLMEALYLSGRQAEALAAFRSARQHLASELGLEPSESLVALEGAILRHESAPTVRESVASAGVGHLPPQPVGSVDRKDELKTLDRLVDGHQLVSVAGTVGIGKTALVLMWAYESHSRFGGGIWWVDARTADDDDGASPSPVDAVSRLAALVGTERAVVVFDNVDCARAGAARAARGLVDSSPAVTVIVTACEPFAFTGGGGMRVGPMAPTEARALLVDRVATLGGRELEPTPELLAALDGNPLAIDIAAGAIALDGLNAPDVIAALPYLVHHDAEADPRHRTMTLAVEDALGVLSESDRAVIEILAQSDEPRSFQACADAVADAGTDGDPAPAAVARLLSASFLRAEVDGLTVPSPVGAALVAAANERTA